MRDFKRLQTDPPQGVNGTPCPDNIMLWNAVIFGPEDTPWDGGEVTRSAERHPRRRRARSRPPKTKTKTTPHRHVPPDDAVLGGVPQQAPRRQVQVDHVPPKQLRCCAPRPRSARSRADASPPKRQQR
jgi:hypothetical protein